MRKEHTPIIHTMYCDKKNVEDLFENMHIHKSDMSDEEKQKIRVFSIKDTLFPISEIKYMTGHLVDEIKTGDIFNSDYGNFYVLEILERRDHKGLFENPADKINSFFKVKVDYIGGAPNYMFTEHRSNELNHLKP